jgi:hypothetical protein
MKIRFGFVSNSSSSSYVVIVEDDFELTREHIIGSDYYLDCLCNDDEDRFYDENDMRIEGVEDEELIAKILKAWSEFNLTGETTIYNEYGDAGEAVLAGIANYGDTGAFDTISSHSCGPEDGCTTILRRSKTMRKNK